MIKYTADEMNSVFELVDIFDINEKTFFKITDEAIQSLPADIYKPLIGYKVKYKVNGDHSHDGQMVEYCFTFEKHNTEQTKIYTEMCLMQGWNHCENEIIK
jgi:hypothetical protein